MGSPETKKKHVKTWLAMPTIAEKLKLLALANKTNCHMDVCTIESILESMKELLLPMVSHLDKPLNDLPGFEHLKQELVHRMRCMPVHEGWLTISRSGCWFAKQFRAEEPRPLVFEFSSHELAVFIFEKLDRWCAELRIGLPERYNLPEEEYDLAFLKNISHFAAFLKFLERCGETVGKVIREHEERIAFMKSRINLMTDFTQALDPLLSGRKTVTLPTFSVFSEYARGSSRFTPTYFDQKQANPASKEFEGCRRNGMKLVEFNSSSPLKSIDDFVQDIGCALRRMEETAHLADDDHNKRKPFSPEEIEKLREVALAIVS